MGAEKKRKKRPAFLSFLGFEDPTSSLDYKQMVSTRFSTYPPLDFVFGCCDTTKQVALQVQQERT